MIITQCSRIIRQKGQLELLKAFLKISIDRQDVFLIILGIIDDVEYYHLLLDFINKNNLKNCRIIVDKSLTVHEILNISDIYVFPSYDETISIAVLEAMSYSLPVVCSNVGGMSECIETGVNGFLVEKDRLELETYKFIHKLAADKQLRKTIGSIARLTIEKKFSKKKLENEYLSIVNF